MKDKLLIHNFLMWRVGIRKEDRRSLCAHANSKVPSRTREASKGCPPTQNFQFRKGLDPVNRTSDTEQSRAQRRNQRPPNVLHRPKVEENKPNSQTQAQPRFTD